MSVQKAGDSGDWEVPRARSTEEVRRESAAREAGSAYVCYRIDESFHVAALDPAASPVTIGRSDQADIALVHDAKVSARHARLVHSAGIWSVEDAGSTNGTRLDGRELRAERRLRDGSVLRVGDTVVAFRDGKRDAPGATIVDEPALLRLRPNVTQRKILRELVQPWLEGTSVPVAPSNREIAERLGYQESTVRDAISDLYQQARLSRRDGGQRAALVRIALNERTLERTSEDESVNLR